MTTTTTTPPWYSAEQLRKAAEDWEGFPLVDAGDVPAMLEQAARDAETLDRWRESINALILSDRTTASVWEKQCEEYWPRNPLQKVGKPPERGRGAIQNWINWLRGRANDLERIVSPEQAEGSD